MAKILKDTEMLDIVRRTIEDNEIDDREQYLKFLDGLAGLITDHFGGLAGQPFYNPDEPDLEFGCSFKLTHDVPEDGGVFRNYDQDVLWEGGKESEPTKKRRIAWLDSTDHKSHIHATVSGVETLCGGHAQYLKGKLLVAYEKDKIRRNDYCAGCFPNQKLSRLAQVPWHPKCHEIRYGHVILRQGDTYKRGDEKLVEGQWMLIGDSFFGAVVPEGAIITRRKVR